ncbi:MAG TPA: hypothetical protein VF941_11740 [Clostridia bacterium]
MNYKKNVAIMTTGYKNSALNLAINAARKHGATHFMSIDNDMVFPPDGINRLLEQDKEIIGATYNERRFPLRSTVKMADESGQLYSGDISQYTETFPVYSLGLGFVLMKMSVFDKVNKPWFNSPLEENDNFSTEDFYFFDKCQKVGIEIFCDPRITVKHKGTYLY